MPAVLTVSKCDENLGDIHSRFSPGYPNLSMIDFQIFKSLEITSLAVRPPHQPNFNFLGQKFIFRRRDVAFEV